MQGEVLLVEEPPGPCLDKRRRIGEGNNRNRRGNQQGREYASTSHDAGILPALLPGFHSPHTLPNRLSAVYLRREGEYG